MDTTPLLSLTTSFCSSPWGETAAGASETAAVATSWARTALQPRLQRRRRRRGGAAAEEAEAVAETAVEAAEAAAEAPAAAEAAPAAEAAEAVVEAGARAALRLW